VVAQALRASAARSADTKSRLDLWLRRSANGRNRVAFEKTFSMLFMLKVFFVRRTSLRWLVGKQIYL